ncbi:MAG: histidine kinase [Burkholderiales bacterium]|nr:histidine kinase [Burkholderiales bacterium]
MPNRSAPIKNEPLIPDCCNIGVVFRVLSGVNLVVLLGVWARGQGWRQGLADFIEVAMLVEMISLLSLLTLCGLRRVAYRQPMSVLLQRLLCAAVPGLIAAALLGVLGGMEWFVSSFPRLDSLFVVLLCLLFGAFFQQYFELRTRAYSPALGEARLQALQARIRPHFLFNSLNAVLSLIRSDPRRAETVLEDLADLFRVLMRDTRNMTTLSEELRLCEQYLAIEKIRLGDRLQVSWRIDKLSPEDLGQIQIPSLLLQPLLENAVHYGVEPALSAATIRIELKRNLDKIEIGIVNPYHADVSLPGGNHLALENIRQRLTLLYDIEAQISYGASDGSFEVHLHFPTKR